jgi:hypothetical protein
MKSVMRKNEEATQIIRAAIMSYWRRKQVKLRRACALLIKVRCAFC